MLTRPRVAREPPRQSQYMRRLPFACTASCRTVFAQDVTVVQAMDGIPQNGRCFLSRAVITRPRIIAQDLHDSGQILETVERSTLVSKLEEAKMGSCGCYLVYCGTGISLSTIDKEFPLVGANTALVCLAGVAYRSNWMEVGSVVVHDFSIRNTLFLRTTGRAMVNHSCCTPRCVPKLKEL